MKSCVCEVLFVDCIYVPDGFFEKTGENSRTVLSIGSRNEAKDIEGSGNYSSLFLVSSGKFPAFIFHMYAKV